MKLILCTVLLLLQLPLHAQDAPSMNDEHSIDPSEFISVIDPKEQNSEEVVVEANRMEFLKKSDRWVTKLLEKLDRARFIVNRRLQEMEKNLNRRLKGKGLAPLAKYHRIYQYLMNPLVNPYTRMTLTNKLTMPPQIQNDPNFQNFENNLNSYANTMAEGVANLKAGLFGPSLDSQNSQGTAMGTGMFI